MSSLPRKGLLPREPTWRVPGRKSCILHTPDKARLMERLPEGNRRAALDVLSEMRTSNAPILNRVRAWKQLAADLAPQIARRLNLAHNVLVQQRKSTGITI